MADRIVTIEGVKVLGMGFEQPEGEQILNVRIEYLPRGTDTADDPVEEKILYGVFSTPLLETGWGGSSEDPLPEGKFPREIWDALILLNQWSTDLAWVDAGLGPVPATVNALGKAGIASEDVLALMEYPPLIEVLENDPDLRKQTIARLQRVIDRLQEQNK